VIDLAVVVGPTAAGKTQLAAGLAASLGGEVVSADAFAVYRGLDIGTDKPSPELRARVPHHVIDVADPRERYSAGMFMRDADAAIAAIRRAGHLPIVAGGTLLYVRAVLHGLFPEPARDPRIRERLERSWSSDPDFLRAWLRLLDPAAAERVKPRDRQRTIRALEVCLAAGRPVTELWQRHSGGPPRYRALILGASMSRAELHARIVQRVDSMFAAGLVEEVRKFVGGGLSMDAHSLKAIGYRECCRVLDGKWTLAQAREATVLATRQLAKRQLTWLRGEGGVVWLSSGGAEALAQAISLVEEARGGTGTGQVEG
jgi:tRNA dimethylallyltransferase